MEDLIANPEQNRERWRRNRLAAIKREIEEGVYETPERIDGTVELVLDEFAGEGDRQVKPTRYIVKERNHGYAIIDTQENRACGWFGSKVRAQERADQRNRETATPNPKGDFVANVQATLPVAAAEEAEEYERFE